MPSSDATGDPTSSPFGFQKWFLSRQAREYFRKSAGELSDYPLTDRLPPSTEMKDGQAMAYLGRLYFQGDIEREEPPLGVA